MKTTPGIRPRKREQKKDKLFSVHEKEEMKRRFPISGRNQRAAYSKGKLRITLIHRKLFYQEA